MLSFPTLEAVPGLRHALTTRQDPASPAAVARVLGFERVTRLCQVHGARVVEGAGAVGGEPRAADALVLSTQGVLGAVFGADCPLLLLVAPEARVLALVHSGWRGTAAGVAGAAVRHLEAQHGVSPDRLLVAIGPSMCAAHYEVGDEVVQAVGGAVDDSAGLFRPTRPGHALLDLGLALERQLAAAGVRVASVERCRACTWEETAVFHSYRRDGDAAGRHALVAGWCDGPTVGSV